MPKKRRKAIDTETTPDIPFQKVRVEWVDCVSDSAWATEKDFNKKFKVANAIVPISIALFANSSIIERKNSNYLSYRSKVWQNTSRGGLPKIFLEDMDFEKYADIALNTTLLFILQKNEYIKNCRGMQ